MVSEPNPFAAPQVETTLQPEGPGGNDEAVRKAHLTAEANIRAIGMLQMVGGGLGALGMTFIVVFAAAGELGFTTAIFVPFIALYAGLFYVGMALRDLQSWARWVVVALCIPGLLGFPIGTLFSIYFLVTLTNAKAKVILTDEYRAIRERTPHIQYRTSPIVWVAVLLLVVGMLGVAAALAV